MKPLILALALAAAMPAQAGEREQLEALRATTQAIIDALVEKGILTDEAAKALVKQAEDKGQEKADAAIKAEAAAGVVRVPYIPEVVKREIREQLRQEVVAQAKTERWGDVNAVPEWVDRLKWEGDIRVRYQEDIFASDNDIGTNFITQPYGLGTAANPINTSEDRSRTRVRARLGLLAKVSDSVSAGFRLTTGNTSDPVSTNQTLGVSGNKYSLVLDRAYGKAKPADWLEITAGRIPNPFFSTDLVWDDDLNFDGVAAGFKPWANRTMTAKPFFTVGVFPLQEVQSSNTNKAKDKWLFAAQGAVDWRSGAYSSWRIGVSYYDYRNIKAVKDDISGDALYEYSDSILSYRQKGNTVFQVAPVDKTDAYGLAADYRVINLTAMTDLSYFDPVHVIFSADVVKNVGYDQAEVASLLGSAHEAKTQGWMFKTTVGKPSVSLSGDWQAYFGYRYLERDAVLDAFTDSDFNLGGTNSKGYFIGGLYGLDRNTWLSLKWQSASEIDGLKYSVNVMQVDLNAKF
ncbi:MAG: outer membrane receptor for ferric coprogen and ferric-rhodotorulic acid [Hydrogenophilales bacterium 28-61-23]|nr:MAG: outer membrane receptor for ferric coprogen and ferric-rhodotorulic acid [Hydrogenophilales bacterium 28-61-23]